MKKEILKIYFYMEIKKKENDLIINIPEDIIGFSEIQNLIDYLRYVTIISKSNAKQKNIDDVANEIDTNWWKENKDRFINESSNRY